MVGILFFVAVIIIYLILSGRKADLSEIRQQGGMKEKYRILISKILETPDSKLGNVAENKVEIDINSQLIRSRFTILHINREVNIWWYMLSPEGKLEEKWKFPEYIDQEKMFEKISSDIEFKLNTIWGIPSKNEILAAFDDRIQELLSNVEEKLFHYFYVSNSEDELRSGMDLVNEVIEMDPENAKAYRLRGLIHIENEKYLEAKSDWNKSAKFGEDVSDLLQQYFPTTESKSDDLPF